VHVHLPGPHDTRADRDWQTDRAGWPEQAGIDHPQQQSGYRDPPTDRNLRPVNVPIDELLEPPDPAGSHRVTP
jgi:hypothetical protein